MSLIINAPLGTLSSIFSITFSITASFTASLNDLLFSSSSCRLCYLFYASLSRLILSLSCCHAWAYCSAVELLKAGGSKVPSSRLLRLF